MDADELLEEAWGVIANAQGGRWEDASPEWREAATRWRDKWHQRLDARPRLNPAESVFGFAGWLTTRKQEVTLSSKHNAAPVADLVKRFIDENHLGDVSERWPRNLTHPMEAE